MPMPKGMDSQMPISKTLLATGLAASSALLLFAGCASTSAGKGEVAAESSMSSEFKDAPKWARTGTCDAAVGADPDSNLCGVASFKVESARRMDLARTTAQAKGCAAIAAILSQHVGRVLSTYQGEESVEGVEGGTASDFESTSRNAVKQIAAMENFTGCEPVDSWISPSDNVYALMKLDAANAMAAFQSVLEASSEIQRLDPEVRQKILDNRDELMKDLPF